MTNFDPSSYKFAAAVYLYSPRDDEAAELAGMIMDDIADFHRANPDSFDFEDYGMALEHANPEGRFARRGTCDHCGAAFHYGARFTNDAGESLIVGNICATNTMGLTGHEYADRRIRQTVQAARSKAKADAKVAALAPNRRAALDYDHSISYDLRAKFRKYHSLSVKQWALAKKLKREGEERAARLAEERAKCNPIPADVLEGRATIAGEVVSAKVQEGYYGSTYKMLVKDDRGFKVWGTVPASIDEAVYNGRLEDGATIRVEFVATVEASDDDDTFGFFKRPSKATAEVRLASEAA
jgi:hypothetical protein